MFFKKLSALTILIIIISIMLCGCNAPALDNSDTIEILCTNYPLYDWVQNITKGADSVKVSFLLKNGVDIHSFQPTADDIIKIKSSDLFIYNGGASEKYLTDIISQSNNQYISATDVVSGTLISSEHAHAGDSHIEYDEHIWLSIKNAIQICDTVSKKIIEIDPENSDIYIANTTAYLAELSELDKAYEQMTENALRGELVVADRYPFAYLMNDYGLVCHSAFPGCSDETDASFATILSLAEKVKELQLPLVLTTDGNNNDIATMVISNSGMHDVGILSLNSLQTITDEEINSGITYVSAMKENLEILRQTLN